MDTTFFSTLIGAFLGVLLPFIINEIIEKKNFIKLLNSIFIRYEALNQDFRGKKNFLEDEVLGLDNKINENYKELLSVNFPVTGDCSFLLIDKYYKYLRPEDVFHLIQDSQNMQVLHKSLLSSTFNSMNDFTKSINAFIEFAVRRTWTVFLIARGIDIVFSIENYNRLIEEINNSKHKTIKDIDINNIFKS